MSKAHEITRTISLTAPVRKVWNAISEATPFGEWFRCTVDGEFAVGAIVNCRSLYEGHENMRWQKRIVAIEPERYFAFEWSPGEAAADLRDTAVKTTLVEFTLRAIPSGTELVIRESGFEIFSPSEIRSAMRLNSEGWDAQADNIRVFIDGEH